MTTFPWVCIEGIASRAWLREYVVACMSAAAPVGANEESFRRVWMSKPIARIATTGCSLLPAFAFFLASLSMPVGAQTIFGTSSPDQGKPAVAMIAPPEPAVPAAVVRQPEEQSEFQ